MDQRITIPCGPDSAPRHSPYWVLDPQALPPLTLPSLSSLASLPPSPDAARQTAEIGTPSRGQECGLRRPPYTIQSGVAVLHLVGTLNPDRYDALRQSLDMAVADPTVRTIVLRINSPGGAVVGVKELADHIRVLTKTKPICAYADGLCASGAYWLAAATSKIYAPITATLGSIGVLSVHYDWSKWNEAVGVTPTYLTAGTYKAVGNPDTPLSDADRDRIGATLTKIHTLFRADVATTMPVEATAPELWGDGQTFLATEAKALGLLTGIVIDFDHLLNTLKDTTMDPTEFARANPELYAAVEASLTETITANAAAAQTAAVASAVAAETERLTALVTLVAGDEAAKRFAILARSNVTADQLSALAPLIRAPEPSAVSTDQSSRQQILAALTTQTPAPVAATPSGATPDPVAAAITRVGSLK